MRVYFFWRTADPIRVIHCLSRRERPGGYALERHKELRKAWQRRMFRGWTAALVVLVMVLGFIGTLLPNEWKTMLLVFAFALPVGWWGIQEALLPDHIGRWRRGAWGEQMTASELKKLRREGWVDRHDVETGWGNHDHLLVGNAVYLLETKYLTDSELTLEPNGLRVRRIDQPSSNYLMDDLTKSMEESGRTLYASLKAATGRRIYVHPVVVLWGSFDAGVQHVRKVAYVDGNQLAEWLRKQPQELDAQGREAALRWLREYRKPRPSLTGARWHTTLRTRWFGSERLS